MFANLEVSGEYYGKFVLKHVFLIHYIEMLNLSTMNVFGKLVSTTYLATNVA